MTTTTAEAVLVLAPRVLAPDGTHVVEGATVLVRDGVVERVDLHVGEKSVEGGPAVLDLGDRRSPAPAATAGTSAARRTPPRSCPSRRTRTGRRDP